jgi:hypothetical protein
VGDAAAVERVFGEIRVHTARSIYSSTMRPCISPSPSSIRRWSCGICRYG